MIQKVDEEEVHPVEHPVELNAPPEGTVEWIHHWSLSERFLPSPIPISITGSFFYQCPPINWFNFDISPRKIKLTNTGYSVILSLRWATERPYLTGGPLLKKYVLSQIHFHWGDTMMRGSDHSVDGTSHPMELQVVYFNTIYLTQDEAFQHEDGVVIVCYLIKFGVHPCTQLTKIIDALPDIRCPKTASYVKAFPVSKLFPLFDEDYFVYWGAISTDTIDRPAMWIVSRICLGATEEQVKAFRSLYDPWDEPNLGNFRPLQDKMDRHVFFVNPHWSTYASLLPLYREEPSVKSVISPAYLKYQSMIPEEITITDAWNTFLAEYISRLPPSQSPIVLYKQCSPPLKQLKPLLLEGYFSELTSCSILNTGQTAYLTYNDEQSRPTVSGGLLADTYLFQQLQFHWSAGEPTGSEHIVDDRGYALEAQFVHYNKKYGSLEKAINHIDGLTVIGFLFLVGEKANPDFEELVTAVRQISLPSQKATLNSASLAWIKKLELYSTYFLYKGSLTTSPFSECVTWIVHDTPIEIGSGQIAAFRALKSTKDRIMGQNIRPLQPCPKGHTVYYVHCSAKPKILDLFETFI